MITWISPDAHTREHQAARRELTVAEEQLETHQKIAARVTLDLAEARRELAALTA